MSTNQMIWEAARRMAEARREAVEEACEKALQGGVCGVLIYRDADGVEHVGPHGSVPYGMIHEYPWGLPSDFQGER